MNQTTGQPAVREMSEVEQAVMFGETEVEADAELEETSVLEQMEDKITGASEVEGVPEWATLPLGFKIPPGKRLGWMKFLAEWTDTPQKGDRWIMMWNLSESEEKVAYKKAGGETQRAIAELAKATLRVIDGVKADRTGASGPGNVAILWAELGTGLRQIVMNYYLKTHTLSPEAQQLFFANFFVVTTAAAG